MSVRLRKWQNKAGKVEEAWQVDFMFHHPDGRRLLEELHHGASFLCDNDPRFFFGLGSHAKVEQVDVLWPDGSTQSFRDVATRRAYLVEQGVAELRPDQPPRGR